MVTLEIGADQQEQGQEHEQGQIQFPHRQRYDALAQRRAVLRREINAIYRRYDEHIGSRLRAAGDVRGLLDLDAMPSDEDYAAYDLANTPLTSLEEQLFKISLAMQDLRLTAV